MKRRKLKEISILRLAYACDKLCYTRPSDPTICAEVFRGSYLFQQPKIEPNQLVLTANHSSFCSISCCQTCDPITRVNWPFLQRLVLRPQLNFRPVVEVSLRQVAGRGQTEQWPRLTAYFLSSRPALLHNTTARSDALVHSIPFSSAWVGLSSRCKTDHP